MRWYFWLAIFAAAMLWGGVQNLYSALLNSSPAEMSCRQYMQSRPDDVWIQLDGCYLAMDDYMYEGSSTRPSKLYIPVKPVDAEENEPAAIVLVTRDSKLRKLVGDMERLSVQEDEQAIEKLIIDNADLVLGSRKVNGLIQFGIDLDDEEKSQIRGLAANLRPDFVMLEDGAEPNMALGAGMTGGGVLIVGILGFAFIRRRKNGQAEEVAVPADEEESPESRAFPSDPQARSGPGA